MTQLLPLSEPGWRFDLYCVPHAACAARHSIPHVAGAKVSDVPLVAYTSAGLESKRVNSIEVNRIVL